MKLTAMEFLTLDGVYQGPGGPDEDRRGGFERGGWQAPFGDEETGQFITAAYERMDAMLLGRVTYQMMEEAWRSPRPPGRPEWTEPFARTIDAAKKYVVSTTLKNVDWNAELIRGDLAEAVERLKREPGKGL